MSVEDFLKNNSDVSRNGDETSSVSDVDLPVLVRGISDKFVDFLHMGLHYRVERKDIIGLEETKNSALGPKSAVISLRRDATLVVQRAVSAIDLANSIPFGYERPSSMSEEGNFQSAREKAWMRSTGYNRRTYDVETLAAGSGTFETGTRCPSVKDDQRADQFASFEEFE